MKVSSQEIILWAHALAMNEDPKNYDKMVFFIADPFTSLQACESFRKVHSTIRAKVAKFAMKFARSFNEWTNERFLKLSPKIFLFADSAGALQ